MSVEFPAENLYIFNALNFAIFFALLQLAFNGGAPQYLQPFAVSSAIAHKGNVAKVLEVGHVSSARLLHAAGFYMGGWCG